MCERQYYANYITVFSSGGAIVSPNFPQNYPDNMECYWTITVSSDKTIKFQFLGSFGLVEHGCTGFLSNNDYVSIKDGSSTQSKLLGKFCRGKPVDPVFSSGDRKSTRLNSSHANISYAVFCLKKKTKTNRKKKNKTEQNRTHYQHDRIEIPTTNNN